MNQLTTIDTAIELSHRESQGVHVWLLWNAPEDRVFVRVHDFGLDDGFELATDGPSAMDVFHHPYAYAAQRGVGYRTTASVAEPVAA